jgi:hypothetical protein
MPGHRWIAADEVDDAVNPGVRLNGDVDGLSQQVDMIVEAEIHRSWGRRRPDGRLHAARSPRSTRVSPSTQQQH